jgi:3-hydroxyacyl-CoA dehydrogenase
MDIAGLDILGHVLRNLNERLTDAAARREFCAPPLLQRLLEKGWVGEKTGQGFYKRQKSAAGETEILTLDPPTLTYRAKQPARLPALDAARGIEDAGERIKTLFLGRDKVGAFLRGTLGRTLVYTARVAPSIAHSIDDVDHAMQWGFGWELGPFQTFDAIGVKEVVDAVGDSVAGADRATFPSRYRQDGVPPAGPGLQILKSAKDRQKTVRRNPGASLVDLGDGVLAVEFHSKMNAIGGDTLQMLHAGVKEASANYAALVVGNEAPNFSAGANLMLLLLEAQEGNWEDIDLMVRMFQDATMALRYCPVPVVVCPAGLTLGGGCEMALHADRVQAAAETYMGLTEVGVGLIPAGGGTKEMLARSIDGAPVHGDLLPFVQRAFETIGFAKVSTSAPDAKRIGYLRDADPISMNRERLIADAKALALERAREGYQPPPARTAIPVGGESVLAALKLGVHLAWRAGRISDHDALIGRTLATILSGGPLPHQTTVSERYLLDLEREAFLKLCGEPKTLERIQHTLKTGKVLRN